MRKEQEVEVVQGKEWNERKAHRRARVESRDTRAERKEILGRAEG